MDNMVHKRPLAEQIASPGVSPLHSIPYLHGVFRGFCLGFMVGITVNNWLRRFVTSLCNSLKYVYQISCQTTRFRVIIGSTVFYHIEWM